MDWQQIAKEDLRRYQGLKQAQKQIDERLVFLEEQYTTLKSAKIEDVPIHGGEETMEDKLLTNIVNRERLKSQHGNNEKVILWVENGLRSITDEERFLLDVFYIRPQRTAVCIAMEKLSYSKTHVYRLRDDALRRFTLYQYGLAEN